MLSTIKIAWRNLGRNRKRTFLALAAIALGQFTMVFVNCMMAGMFGEILDTITGPMVGHVQVHHPAWREERALDLYIEDIDRVRARVARLPGVESVFPRVFAGALAATGGVDGRPSDAEVAIIVGVDIAAESGKGGFLEEIEERDLPSYGEVVIGRALAKRLGVQAGDELAIIGQDADEFPMSELLTVKTVMRSPTEIVDRMGVVMNLKQAQGLLALSGQAHELVIRGQDDKDAEALAEKVSAVPGLEKAEVLSWREAVPELVSLIDMKDWMDLIFVLILFVAAAAGIVNTIMMSVFERTRELGTLLALGARPARIVGLIFTESVILGLVGVAIGSILGVILVTITSYTGINYAALAGTSGEELEFGFKGLNLSYMIYPVFEARQVWFGVGAVTATAILASLWPAIHAARLHPAEAMRS